jgi:hypothetical protein
VCERERERERERESKSPIGSEREENKSLIGSENLPGTCKDGGRKVLGTYIKTDELQI